MLRVTARFLALLLLVWPGLVSAQGCQQPSQQGCPLDLDEEVAGVIRDSQEAHYWQLTVPNGGDFELLLTNLGADYRLYVYDPARNLVGQSRNEGLEDEVIEVDGASPGRYFVIVDSEWGETSPRPYQLVATYLGGASDAVSPVVGPQAGAVLLVDAFDDPNAGQLSRTSPETESYVRAYVGGEYQIYVVDPDFDRIPIASVPGIYDDATFGIDVRLVGDAAERVLYFGCREQTDGNSEYRFLLEPDARRFRVQRWDDGRSTTLVDWQTSSAIQPGNASNRVELHCDGDTIAASVNGTPVVSLADSTYPDGRLWFGVATNLQATAEARYNNLVVTRGASPAAPAALILLAESFDNPATGQLPPAAENPRFSRAYVGGEYQVRKLDPEWDAVPIVFVPGEYTDATLALDARIVGDTTGRRILMACRARSDIESEYRFTVEPYDQTFLVTRLEDGQRTVLAGWDFSSAINPGNASNHLELSCAGNTISGSINGTEVFTLEDDTFGTGQMWIGVGDDGTESEARFDNLVIIQQ